MPITSEVFVQVKFRATEPGRPDFSDAPYFREAEYRALTGPEIAAMQRARHQRWKDQIDEASKQITPPPTKEELQAEYEALQARQAELEAQLKV